MMMPVTMLMVNEGSLGLVVLKRLEEPPIMDEIRSGMFPVLQAAP